MTLEGYPILGLQYNPKTSSSKLYLIQDIIESQSLTTNQIAEEAEYSKVKLRIVAETCGSSTASMHSQLAQVGN